MRLLTQTSTLARRSVKHTFRQPAAIIPSLLFPLLFMAVTTAGAGAVALLPGFPARSYMDFYIAGALLQGTLFGGIGAGTALAVDIEEGFIRRLLLTPLQRPAILVATAAGAMVVGGVQASLLLAGGMIGGARIVTGAPGAIAVIGLAMLAALAFASIGALIATWTGSSEATQVFFPFLFVSMIFSSFFMPRGFINAGWFRTVADHNPVTFVIEGIREPIIAGWGLRPILYGLAATAAIAFVGFTGAAVALRTRLGRT